MPRNTRKQCNHVLADSGDLKLVLNKIAQCFPSGIMQFLNQHTSKYQKRSKHFVCTQFPGSSMFCIGHGGGFILVRSFGCFGGCWGYTVVGYPSLLTEIVYDCAEITRTIATSSARSPRPSVFWAPVFCGYFDLVAIT